MIARFASRVTNLPQAPLRGAAFVRVLESSFIVPDLSQHLSCRHDFPHETTRSRPGFVLSLDEACPGDERQICRASWRISRIKL